MKIIISIFLCIFTISCSLNQSGDFLSVEEKAIISLMVQDYSNHQMILNTGSMESDDYNENAGTYVENDSLSRSIFVITDDTYQLDDGTEVVITKEIDDKDTVESTDDEIRVTRSYYYNYELWKTEMIVRPVKPELEWDTWNNNQIVQEGVIRELIGDIILSTGSIAATWEKINDEVILTEIIKISFNTVTNIKRITTIEFDENLINQTVTKYHWNGSELVFITELLFEQIEINGEFYTKLIKEDGSYIIIRQRYMPQIREYYNSNDELQLIETIGKNGGLRSEVTRDYYDNGTLIESKVINISYRIDENSVLITREIDSMDKKFKIYITESVEGYWIERNGFAYYVTISDDNSVNIYSENGVWLGEITTNDKNSATVKDADGTTTVSI